MRGTRVVVIGGGVVGLWTALHLRERGAEVCVLEQGEFGEGATAAATGGLRSQFSHPANIALALRSLEQWDAFEARTGAELVFRRHGYLFLHDRAEVLESVLPGLQRLRELGVPALALEPHEIAPHFPGVRTEDLVGATFTPHDGSASPADATRGLVAALRGLDARLCRHTRFEELVTTADGAVRGVRTSQGEVPADHVVLATGPAARATAARCGLDVPVSPRSRQAFAVRLEGGFDPALPLTIDMGTGAYVHPESESSAVIGGHDRAARETDQAQVDWDRLESLAGVLTHRFPALEDLEVGTGWAGLREMTPDDLPVLGAAPGVPGLWLAVGFSGHGFTQAPGAASALAALIAGEPTGLDLDALALERFDGGPIAAAEAAVF